MQHPEVASRLAHCAAVVMRVALGLIFLLFLASLATDQSMLLQPVDLSDTLLVFLFSLVFIMVTASPQASRPARIGLGGLILLGMYFYFEVPLRGDGFQRVAELPLDFVYASEMLSSLFFKLTATRAQASLLPPVFGLCTFLAFALFVERGFDDRTVRATLYALYPATGVHLVFVRGYIENTSMGLPLLVLALAFARQAGRRPDGTDRNWIASYVVLFLAALTHGQYLFFLPGYFAAFAHARLTGQGGRMSVPVFLGLLAGISAAFVGGLVLFTKGFGFLLVGGNASGGRHMFVNAPTLFEEGVVAGLVRHVLFIANAAILAAPLLLFQATVYRSSRWRWIPRRPGEFAMLALAGCYLVFASIWEFDMGFPEDYDLIISGGLALHLFVAWLLAGTLRERKTSPLPYALVTAAVAAFLYSPYLL